MVSSPHEAETDASPAMRRGAFGYLLDGRLHRWRFPRRFPSRTRRPRPHKKSEKVELALRPEHDSGVSGTASLEDTSDGVLVKLNLRNLPKPNTFYLAHIHPGTCAEGETHEPGCAHGAEGHGHEHSHEPGGATHEHGAGAKIEYPLSQVRSDLEGQGSSTTTLRQTSVDKLFSGDPKYVNVHKAGGGNPPILTCANLKRAG